jgi:catechol 2,3-dioxygenase-like lactoylglutathione lyase family enzyme
MSFDHCGFQVSNMQKAIEFYTGKMGFKLLFLRTNEEVREEYAFLDYDGARIELIADLDGNFVKPEITKHFCPHACLETHDMSGVIETLKKNSIPVIGGPHFIEDEEAWLYIKDEDNNVLEFIQWFHK